MALPAPESLGADAACAAGLSLPKQAAAAAARAARTILGLK